MKTTETTEALKTKKNDYYLVDAKNIVVEESFNVRTDYGDIDGLAQSIMAVGQLEPVIGFKKHGTEEYVLTDGHRRFKAIQMAIEKGADIPYVKLLIGAKNIEDRIFSMVITGVDKKTLNILEEGEAYKRLVAHGYEIKEIAAKVGKTVAHIGNLLKLADVPQKVKTAIIKEEINGSTVINILREVKDEQEVVNVVTAAVQKAKEEGSASGKKIKKATVKHTGIDKLISPLQKLRDSYAALIEENPTFLKRAFMEDLIGLLNDKKSTVEDVSSIFR